jgi:hypothetical protein
MDDYVFDMSMVAWSDYSIATSQKRYIGKDLIVRRKKASQAVTMEFFHIFVYRSVLLHHGHNITRL